MQGKYITKAAFAEFKKNELANALSVIDINLKNPNLSNQVAARALGYRSYEALEPLFAREDAIKHTFTLERTIEQANRLTLKSKNIIVVFDFSERAIFGKSLSNGEENVLLCADNAMLSIDLTKLTSLNFDLMEPLLDITPVGGINWQHLTFGDSCGMTIIRSDIGLKVTLDERGSPLENGEIDLQFADADFEYNTVDLVTPLIGYGKVSSTKYQFKRPFADPDNGKIHYVDIGGGEEASLSDLLFDTPDEAYNAVDSGDWGWQLEDLEGACLVKVESTVERNFMAVRDDWNDDPHLENGKDEQEVVVVAKGITLEYVAKRQLEFLDAYKRALVKFGHSESYIEESVKQLAKRFCKKDYKLYKYAPIGHLHASKRIARNAIRGAILHAPARKARIERWRKEYSDECSKVLERQPNASFYSFEARYSSKLKVDFGQYKDLFKI